MSLRVVKSSSRRGETKATAAPRRLDNSTTRRLATRIRELASPEQAQFNLRYFKTAPGQYGEGDRFLGLRVPQIRLIAREHEHFALGDIEKLLDSPWHEERLIALLILVRQFAKVDTNVRSQIYRLYLRKTDRINNWDLVDSSAPHIVGAHLEDRDRKPLYRLARSKSLWERRIAILATQYYIRRGDFRDALAIAEILIEDRHDLIHKAVGWMLREVGNRDRAAEETFLQKHAAHMPRTMLRYAIEKFPETLRRRYLEFR